MQVPPGASDVPQDVVVKVNNPAPFPIPAAVSPVIVTGVGALAAVPVFVIVTTAVMGPVRVELVGNIRVRAPPTVVSDPPVHVVPVGQVKVAAVKANGPAATPLPERLTGLPVPVAGTVVVPTVAL